MSEAPKNYGALEPFEALLRQDMRDFVEQLNSWIEHRSGEISEIDLISVTELYLARWKELQVVINKLNEEHPFG
jgi:hypothetical protein